MRRVLMRSLVACGRDVSWFTWAAFLAFLIAGVMLRGVLAEAELIPWAGAGIAAIAVGSLVYRWEFGRRVSADRD